MTTNTDTCLSNGLRSTEPCFLPQSCHYYSDLEQVTQLFGPLFFQVQSAEFRLDQHSPKCSPMLCNCRVSLCRISQTLQYATRRRPSLVGADCELLRCFTGKVSPNHQSTNPFICGMPVPHTWGETQ